MKNPSLFLITFIMSVSFAGCNDAKKEAETENVVTAALSAARAATTNLAIEAADYEIAKVEDLSRKAFGKKSLSQYTTSELEQLPTNKKVHYSIILSKDIKQHQVKPTVEKIVHKLTSDDSDIDEIILSFYSSKEGLDNPYDIGTAVWAPNGELGNIDANIAINNSRENYKIEYRIKENIEEYLEQISKSETKFGLTENERKLLFKDIVSAEDKADDYRRIEQNKVLDGILEKYGKLDDNGREIVKKASKKIGEKADKIMAESKLAVLNNYGITEEQAGEISEEAIAENWPFE